ncbi:hypothetical protein F4778DRAFT_786419 [Xylariomycetidae sp. FL2044]|nr:hypothetical protein F4778DRAFT_786419 [Xylariomycetidae sp. FL2044]
MFARDYKKRKSVVRMDPDCAICQGPASLACDCEAKGLEVAVRQAETRMMQSVYNDIRGWVRAHAQDYILEYFRLLTERRKDDHSQQLERLTAHAHYYYHAPPHPNEITALQVNLKRGIDEDWQSSVQRYPEVLEYFYSLVALTLPKDSDPQVKDPPLSALSGSRKTGRRGSTIAPDSLHTRERSAPNPVARRTPPPPSIDRRTPGPGPVSMIGNPLAPAPRSRHHAFPRPPTAPPSNYYGGY